MSVAAGSKLEAVPFTKVKIEDQFWSQRIRTNRERTLPVEFRMCQETGRIDALKRDWKPGMPNKPHHFWDSDVAKWIEAASYSLATHPDPELAALVDRVVALVKGMQRDDGYLHSYFSHMEPGKIFTNLRDLHELYTAGHMIEAGVAHFQATGQRTLLDVVCRCADHIASVFGTEPGQKRGYDGHEEIELALVKLYRATGLKKYLELSRFFVDERGRGQPHFFDEEAITRGDDPKKFWATNYSYCQAHAPVREQCEVTGHAVRAMYLYCGMADLAGEFGDQSLLDACNKLWSHAVQKLMYITGGIGTSRHNEGFTFDYDLPNESAYCETCAAIGLVFFSHRMLQLDCDSKYADVIERCLYNGVLSGVSLDGARFFYENPLASVGQHHRKEWFGCACCPPNIARVLASLGEYIYSQSDSEAIVHQYVQGQAELRVGGNAVTLSQQTEFPWDGKVTIRVAPARKAAFALKLRVPGWCAEAEFRINGRVISAPVEKGYLVVEREWQSGDAVELTLPMPVQRVYSRPKVRMNCGRVALQRGPLVYCLEGVDNGLDLDALAIPRGARISTAFRPDLLGGAVVLHSDVVKLLDDDRSGELYRTVPPEPGAAKITAVPYCLWDNREAGGMLVWVREA